MSEPTKFASSLQAILHRGNGGMETIGVPVPLPDAIVRLVEAAGADEPSYHVELFRRVRSSDSVVRYYEHPEGIVLAGETGAQRVCVACGERSECYFVRFMALDEMLTLATRAVCAGCYS